MGILIFFGVAERELASVGIGIAPDVSSAETRKAPAPLYDREHLPPPPELRAEAYIVRLIGDDYPLLRRREEKELAPASLTKILTSVLAKEELSEQTRIVFSKEAKNVEQKTSAVAAGEEFLRDDVIAFALIESANDAARALAQAIGARRGGKSFEERMNVFEALINQKIRALGLTHTYFSNATGLDKENHYSSAKDLAEIAEYAWVHHPDIWEISRLAAAAITSQNGTVYEIENTNDLLREFPGIRGGKTGFTDNALEALILLYPVRPSYTAVIVLLRSEDRFGDGRKVIRWLEEAFQ